MFGGGGGGIAFETGVGALGLACASVLRIAVGSCSPLLVYVYLWFCFTSTIGFGLIA